MIHFIFDLDDTIIMHNGRRGYDWIQPDLTLSRLLDECKEKGTCYIYTNGTAGHAVDVLERMNIKTKFKKAYSRDTMDYMKPDMNSFIDVHDNISYDDPEPKVIFFFDDQLNNLKTAHDLGWKTIWIHPRSDLKWRYPFVNLAFNTINDSLLYLSSKF